MSLVFREDSDLKPSTAKKYVLPKEFANSNIASRLLEVSDIIKAKPGFLGMPFDLMFKFLVVERILSAQTKVTGHEYFGAEHAAKLAFEDLGRSIFEWFSKAQYVSVEPVDVIGALPDPLHSIELAKEERERRDLEAMASTYQMTVEEYLQFKKDAAEADAQLAKEAEAKNEPVLLLKDIAAQLAKLATVIGNPEAP